MQSFHDSDQLPDDSMLEFLAGMVDMWVQDGHHVLVHCQAGLNRSGLITGLYLIRHRGMPPQAAIALQRERRDEFVLCNARFERYLLDLDPATRLPTAETTTFAAVDAPIGGEGEPVSDPLPRPTARKPQPDGGNTFA